MYYCIASVYYYLKGNGLPFVIDNLKVNQQKPQVCYILFPISLTFDEKRLYAAACVANASSHPRLAAVLNQQARSLLIMNIDTDFLHRMYDI